MIDTSDEEGLLEGEDYYALLNISKNASNEEITTSYRRLSRIYHPDKHQNPDRKKEAEALFSKTKKAYEALIDPHRRAIYDCLGESGLEAEGLEVAHFSKTPGQIREEYETLARERKQLRQLTRASPKVRVALTVNATDLFTEQDDEFYEDGDWSTLDMPTIELSGLNMSSSVQAPVTDRDTLFFHGNVAAQNGRGDGGVGCSLRHLLSDQAWLMAEVTCGNTLSSTLKGFYTLWPGVTSEGSLMFNFSANSLHLHYNHTLSMQLGPALYGHLTLRLGRNHGLTTLLLRETPGGSLALSSHLGAECFLAATALKRFQEEGALRLHCKVSTSGYLLEYGGEKRVSENTTIGACMWIGVPLGVSLKLSMSRSGQKYNARIILCDEVLPAPVIYGTLLPLGAWVAAYHLVVKPLREARRRKVLARQRAANREKTLQRRQEALAATALMRETVSRCVELETARKGLIILSAIYGRLVVEGKEVADEEDTLDVTVPLQCLVVDSKLVLTDVGKAQLSGFYDPCPGEAKQLRVRYLFRSVLHQCTVGDSMPLRVPRQSHRIPDS